jgi:hypothetical protein
MSLQSRVRRLEAKSSPDEINIVVVGTDAEAERVKADSAEGGGPNLTIIVTGVPRPCGPQWLSCETVLPMIANRGRSIMEPKPDLIGPEWRIHHAHS